MTHPLPEACKLPIKTLVARQLPTNTHTQTHTHSRIHTYTIPLTYTCMHTHSSCTVPSGHILTKDELLVLGALLASYGIDKLKSFQLSLQEEQEIRDISREEVEKSLRQRGLDSMAEGLRDNLEKGMLNEMTSSPSPSLACGPNAMLEKKYS